MKKTALLSLFVILSSGYFLSAQTLVSTDPQPRNVVLEEYTGIHCQYCPDGHRIAQALANANPGRVVLVNIHQGSYAIPSGTEPDYRTPFGDALAGQTGLTGYPTGTVNRHVFTELGGTTTAMDRGTWGPASDIILAGSTPVNVGVKSELDTITRLLTVTVELYYTSNSAVSSNYINVALLQNNVFGPQTNGGAGSNYRHMHMLRYLVTGQWGDVVTTTTEGTLVTRVYTYTIPAGYNSVPCVLSNCDVAVFVTQSHQEVLSGAVVKAIDGTNKYTGKILSPQAFAAAAPSTTAIFNVQGISSLASGEEFTVSLIPIDTIEGWTSDFVINGIHYDTPANFTFDLNTPKDIVINITPGTTAGLAGYRLFMQSVTFSNAPPITADVHVISGITDLVVNGSGGPLSTAHQDVYLAGLAYAGCLSYTSTAAGLFVQGMDAQALAGVKNIYYNVAWTFPALKDNEALALEAFMNNGGNVLIAGQDIGWDIMSGATGSNGTAVTRDFYTNYLHAGFVDDGSTANNQITANPADTVYGLAGNSTITDIYGGMYPDQINAISPAVPIFYYKNNTAKQAALRCEADTFDVVYFGVGLEMMSTVAVRNEIMKITYDYFNADNSNVGFDEAIAKLFGQNYPNPADNYTVFPLKSDTRKLILTVSDLTGRVLISQMVESGANQVEINTSDLPDGYYIGSLKDGANVLNSNRILVSHK
ncbi:MAG: Omp28-related outer membrane protein [Bacteroidales bacterium]